MTEAAFVVLVVAFPVLGVAVPRWPALLFPLVGWPLFYIGLDHGWWGDGTGDGWRGPAFLSTTAGVVTTAAAVAVSRGVRRRSAPRNSRLT